VGTLVGVAVEGGGGGETAESVAASGAIV